MLDSNKLMQWIDEQEIQVIPCVPSLFRMILNQELRPEAFHSQVAMAALCGVFVVVCVRSFIAARKRRKLREAGGAV